MLPRFLGEIDAASGTARLPEDETRHLSQVLRLGAGDEIAVFDGRGREYRARVERVFRDRTELRVIEESPASPEPAVRLTLAQAALKGEKMDDVVRDATMMGVAAIEPLITDHTVAHMKEGRAPDRWRRIAIASAKQCRRAVVPEIGPGTSFPDWVARDQSMLKILLIEPSASEKTDLSPFLKGKTDLSPFSKRKTDLSPFSKRGQVPFSASLVVGPEGGWSDGEVEAAIAAGYEPLTLGRRTLRADAVAVIAISVLQYEWGDL